MRLTLLIVSIVIFGLAGCGAPSAPLPPSLELPKFVDDLRAFRKGEHVVLQWTTPTETTDEELVRKPGKMLVQRGPLLGPGQEVNWQTIAELPLPPALKHNEAAPATSSDDLTFALAGTPPGDFMAYGVIAQNRLGKSFGLPNRVLVPLVPTPPAPHTVHAEAIPKGIRISWEQALAPENKTHLSTQYGYKVMRLQEGAGEPVLVKQLGPSDSELVLVDSTLEWEKNYQYWITPVTIWHQGATRKGEVEGDDSPIAQIFAHDVFPPAVPAGLEAVFSGPQQPFIDLTWSPNTEPDLAGYNVYRREANQQPAKINPAPVKTPSFRDPNVHAGTRYFYTVSAIDLHGNESAKSAETSELVPKE